MWEKLPEEFALRGKYRKARGKPVCDEPVCSHDTILSDPIHFRHLKCSLQLIKQYCIGFSEFAPCINCRSIDHKTSIRSELDRTEWDCVNRTLAAQKPSRDYFGDSEIIFLKCAIGSLAYIQHMNSRKDLEQSCIFSMSQWTMWTGTIIGCYFWRQFKAVSVPVYFNFFVFIVGDCAGKWDWH